MNCPTCGTPIGPGVLVCPNCGTQTAPSTGQVYRGAPAPSTFPGSAPLMQQQVQQRITSNLAVASLCLGIASWVAIPLIGSIGAIITGHMARTQIRQSGGRMEGDGLALGGLITGYSSLVLSCLGAGVILLIVLGMIGAASQGGLPQ